MALINDFDSGYIFSMDCRKSYLPMADNNVTPLWNFEEDNYQLFDNASGVKYQTGNFLFPEQLGLSRTLDVADPVMHDIKIDPGLYDISGFENFQPEGYECVAQCNHFVSDFHRPVYCGNDAWAVHSQQGNSLAIVEEPSMKIRPYSEEERKDRINRYLNKRNRRNFNKTIKYACRKTLADRRIRVRGRFARNNDACEESTQTVNNKSSCQEQEEYYDEDAEIKDNGEEWLQEAVASLMYLPIFSG